MTSTGSAGAAQRRGNGGAKVPDRRLVRAAAARQEHRPARLQGTHLRFGLAVRGQTADLMRATPTVAFTPRPSPFFYKKNANIQSTRKKIDSKEINGTKASSTLTHTHTRADLPLPRLCPRFLER